MKIYTVKNIIKRLKQDDMTDYLERLQYNKHPMWIDWFNSDNVYKFEFRSNHDGDEREFEDDVKIIGIPLLLVDMLARVDSLNFVNNSNPLLLDSTRMKNEEEIAQLKNELWGLSYRYSHEGYGKHDLYVFWVWSDGYFEGVYKGRKAEILYK